MEAELRVGVEGAERLVHQEDLGIDDEGPHERHALPHAARERRGERVLEPLEAREPDALAHAPRLFGALHAAVLEAQRDVPGDGAPREDGVLLEDVTDLRRDAGDGPAVELDRTGRGRDEAAEHVEDGGLAAARRPDDRDEFRVVDLEGDVAHGGDLPPSVAEGLREVADDEARAPRAQDLYFAWAFRTNERSTALANATGLSIAIGMNTFMPFA